MVLANILALDVDQLNEDWQWMLRSLGEVLHSGGDDKLAGFLPSPGAKFSPEDAPTDSVQLTQAYSIAFQLLGMAEQTSAGDFRTSIEADSGMSGLPAMWGESLRELVEAGWTGEQIAAALPSMGVELVLTAHPTEAKRATVLAHHRRIFERFRQRRREGIPPWQRDENEREMKSILKILWRTGEIYLDKPDLQSERRNVMDYLTHVFPNTLAPLDRRLRRAWSDAGLDPETISDPLALPVLTFGTWVGGDRDGHPLVTPEVTAETLAQLRDRAIDLLRGELVDLARLLSLSAYWLPPPTDFLSLIASVSEAMGPAGSRAMARNPNEPWRQFINLMLARLPTKTRSIQQDDALETADRITYADAGELLTDLRHLYQSLVHVGMEDTAQLDVAPLMRIAQTFQFHLAVLDIRQNSAKHDVAIEQLMAVAGFDDTAFSTWSESKRLDFLEAELAHSRPFIHIDDSPGEEADAVLGALRVVKRHGEQFGWEGLGALIVSMTRSTSDLLAVYLLAREVGLLKRTDAGVVCPLPVVPLFETIDDLERSPGIYDAFLAHPITQASLKAIGDRRSKTNARVPAGMATSRVGQIMIGYSDSNKDGGILASLVGLRHAQRQLTKVGLRHDVRVRFFHGRGGTISRGAGPTHRFIRSLPNGTIAGDMRLTEQGETISQKYAHQSTAVYNLELFLAGVARKTLDDSVCEQTEHRLESTLVDLAQWARESYHQLLHRDGFVPFFRSATPIDAIEQSRIGSRPSRRTGNQTLDDLRAIPWVFAWSQARCYLSGWYGVGTALLRLKSERSDDFEDVVATLRSWAPLHYLISNVATSVAAVDMDVMKQYAELVGDESLRHEFIDDIEKEWILAGQMIESVYGGPLDSQRPNVKRMIELRHDGLRLLHHQQIGLLKRWRSYQRMGETTQADALLPQLLLSINAIASGLGTTG
ncbi:MAG: phosphoenolpyruvate carboxylase [Planctomycetota bacterium]